MLGLQLTIHCICESCKCLLYITTAARGETTKILIPHKQHSFCRIKANHIWKAEIKFLHRESETAKHRCTCRCIRSLFLCLTLRTKELREACNGKQPKLHMCVFGGTVNHLMFSIFHIFISYYLCITPNLCLWLQYLNEITLPTPLFCWVTHSEMDSQQQKCNHAHTSTRIINRLKIDFGSNILAVLNH